MKVSDIVDNTLQCIEPDLSVLEASRFFLEHDLDGAQVVDADGKVIGLLTRSDLLRVISEGYPNDTPVSHLMSNEQEMFDFIDELYNMLKLYETNNLSPDDLNKIIPTIDSNIIWTMYQVIKKKKDELESYFNSIYNPIISIDDKECIKIYNKSVEKITGIATQDARGKNIMDIFPASGLSNVFRQGIAEPTQKYQMDGKTYLSNRSPIFNNGKIIGAIAVLQEISELENIVEELTYTKRLNRELDAIFDSSFDGLYITDGQANTLRLNQGFERIMGISASECIGRNMADLVREGIFSRSGTLLALEKRERVTIALQAKTMKTALVTSTPIYDDEGNIGLVVTNVRDITELNDLQDKLEHVEGLSRFYQTELQQMKLHKQCIIHSHKMRELIDMVMRVAQVDSIVLIQGESGVGKELVANNLHTNSNRKNGPFLKVNCGAIPENLLESELFGYEPGAFSGASKNGKAGLFELAEGGTLFLDEIGELSLKLQVKLLRVIQDKEILRLGGTKPMKLDLRILAGTNRDLRKMIANRQFRVDLYYRLNVVPIRVPALRERREDIPVLSKYFLEYFNQKYCLRKRLNADIISYFMDYDWPGNVRELENLIERLVIITPHDTINIHDLSFWSEQLPKAPDMETEIIPLRRAVENTERKMLQSAFRYYNSTYEVARVLGINQSTVVRKAAKYGIRRS